MKLEDVNRALETCGYTVIAAAQYAALNQALGEVWQGWLGDCVGKGRASEHWSSFRSCAMAVSGRVDHTLAAMGIGASLADRVCAFDAQGAELRNAFAAVWKEGIDPSKRTRAQAYIASCFGSGPVPRAPSIADKVHHIYASKSALTFECTTNSKEQACLQVEAAGREDRTQGFDWQRKIILQLSDVETMQVLAVLRGWTAKVEFANHGSSRDKRLTIASQGSGGFTASVRQGSVARMVPIPPFEAYKVISMIMRVLSLNSPHLSPEMIVEMGKELAANSQVQN